MVSDADFGELLRRFNALQARVDKLDTQGSAGQTVNSTAAVSTGTGTVKMNGATSRNNIGWVAIKNQSGVTVYVPYWTTITG